MDGVSAVPLLAKIEDRNQDKRIIHVIWDNAAYHEGPDVRAFLSRKNCRIHLIQLPPYCPYLNPLERLWAVMHQHVTQSRLSHTKTGYRCHSEGLSKNHPKTMDRLSNTTHR